VVVTRFSEISPTGRLFKAVGGQDIGSGDYRGQGRRLERVAVLRLGLFNDIRLQASLKTVPLCEMPVLTATLLRSRRAVSTLFSVLEAVRCTTL